MNANELYEKLLTLCVPIIHVEEVEATMNMKFPISELEKHIEILSPKFLLVESFTLREQLGLNELDAETERNRFFREHRKYISEYIENDPSEKKNITEIKKKVCDDKGMVTIGFVVDGCILSLVYMDDWAINLSHLIEFIGKEKEKEKEEVVNSENLSYWENVNRERQAERLEKEKIEEEKEKMIDELERTSEGDSFKNIQTSAEIIVYWEKLFPNLYKILSRSFTEKLARRYAVINRKK